MAIKEIYIIGDETRMVVRSFLSDLRESGLTVHTLPAMLDSVSMLPRNSIHIVVCFDDTMTADVMEYLREGVLDKGWYLYLIGKITGLPINEQKQIMQIPGVRFPYWPVSAKKLLAEIEKNRKHILVVDDEPMMLRSIYSWLSDAFNIHPANSGQAALEYLYANDVDLVLLDYEMPGMNGRDVLAQIRNSFNMKNLPVMFLTAKNDRGTVTSIMDLHPNGYILKTSTPEEIKLAVTSFFASKSSFAESDVKLKL